MDKLQNVYFSSTSPGSFGGKLRFLRELQKLYPRLTKRQAEAWLKKQDTYNLFRPVRRKFNRLPIIVSHLNEQWQADLMDVSWYKRYNDGVRYLLTVVNVLSRYAWVEPLRDKTSTSIIKAFERIITAKNKPDNLQTDQGREFKNKFFQDWLAKRGVSFFTTTNDDIKCAIVERFNRTLRERLYRLMHWKKSFRYIDDLQKIVQSYNKSYHRTIEMSPAEVTKKNESIVTKTIKKNRLPRKITIGKPLEIGSFVRITRKKGLFEKGAESGWSKELFKIEERKETPIGYVYKLVDWDGEPITSIFYQPELTKVDAKEEW